jgi:hypothetical protein
LPQPPDVDFDNSFRYGARIQAFEGPHDYWERPEEVNQADVLGFEHLSAKQLWQQ